MKTPEPTEAQNDKAYCEYLEGYDRGSVGFLMMIAGLEKIYEEEDNGRFAKDRRTCCETCSTERKENQGPDAEKSELFT